MEDRVRIREARADDVSAMVEIYNHEVEHGLSNYESRPQTHAERAEWLAGQERGGYPVRVAELDGKVVGYGALSPFRLIGGYRYTVVATLYIRDGSRGAGIGKKISEALRRDGRERGFHSVIAGVNSRNEISLRLMESMGFERVGYFREIGQKNGEWFDDICLQLFL
jgi:phosphinothricin acetyltransferase